MSIFNSLSNAYSGLSSSQKLVDVTSNNIANAENEGYTRQRVNLTTARPIVTSSGTIVSQGVSYTNTTRIHNDYVYERYRKSSSDVEFYDNSYRYLNETSSYFADIDDAGVFKDLQEYFNAWESFSVNPSDSSHKIALAEYTKVMGQDLNYLHNKIAELQDNINSQIEVNVNEFNRLGEKVVELNREIKVAENGNNVANDLRDERDRAELAMSKLIGINVFKKSQFTDATSNTTSVELVDNYNISVAGYSVVNGEHFNKLELTNKNSTGFFNIKFPFREESVDVTDLIKGGKVGSLLDLRGSNLDSNGIPKNGKIQSYLNNLNSLSKGIIESTNNIYAQSAFFSADSNVLKTNIKDKDVEITADMLLKDTDLHINTARDTVKDRQPSFNLVVYDNEGNEISSKNIQLNENSTIQSILDDINSDLDDNGDNDRTNDIDDYFTAEFTGGVFKLRQKSIAKDKEYSISIQDDKEVSSNFAGAIGISRFLDGDGAGNIALNKTLTSNPLSINAYEAPAIGDNKVANAMLQLQYDDISFYDSLNNRFSRDETISSFYKTVSVEISSDTVGSSTNLEAKEAVYNTVKQEFDNVSKVSIDEELSKLLRYQTSYQASAKVITTIDTLIETLLGLKR